MRGENRFCKGPRTPYSAASDTVGELERRTVLPFFVYGTLRPGEPNHDLFLRGRTRAEEPPGCAV